MSREDPQFKLRMPAELRSLADQAAKTSGRSLNAELVARIEASFLGDASPKSLMPANRARELALMARSGIHEEVMRRVVEAIAAAVRLGHNEAFVPLNDLHLESGIPDKELDGIQELVVFELTNAGYRLDWDDISTIFIEF